MVTMALSLSTGLGRAQSPPSVAREEAESVTAATPELAPMPALGALARRALSAVEVKILGDRWLQPVEVRSVRRGERLTAALARRAARELTDSGRYARVTVSADASGDQVVLRLFALPRRLIASIDVEGGKLDEDALLREARNRRGGGATPRALPRVSPRTRAC